MANRIERSWIRASIAENHHAEVADPAGVVVAANIHECGEIAALAVNRVSLVTFEEVIINFRQVVSRTDSGWEVPGIRSAGGHEISPSNFQNVINADSFRIADINNTVRIV